MTIIEYLCLAHIIGVVFEEQSEFMVGSYPWCAIEMNLEKLAVLLTRTT